MTEVFLYYIWRNRLFDHFQLYTTDGEEVEVVYPGEINSVSGPDFFNARIRIDHTLWVGNVEIHTQSSHWYVHGHEKDEAYHNVILHVVYQEDQKVVGDNEKQLPCLELRDRIDRQVLKNSHRLLNTNLALPCSPFFSSLTPLERAHFLDRAMTERMESKVNEIRTVWQVSKQHWKETLFISLARSFGFKYNSSPFEQLVRSVPFAVWERQQSDFSNLLSLLVGQSGYMERKGEGDFNVSWSKRYFHLQKKYQLEPLRYSVWKRGGVRPGNQPIIRIIQLAVVWHSSPGLFNAILNRRNWEKVMEIWGDGGEWPVDFSIGLKKEGEVRLTKSAIQNIFVNAIVPLVFFYGMETGNEDLKKTSLNFLCTLPSEKNNRLAYWKDNGFVIQNAFDAQAILHQYSRYCLKKKCLNCTLGKRIIKMKTHD